MGVFICNISKKLTNPCQRDFVTVLAY